MPWSAFLPTWHYPYPPSWGRARYMATVLLRKSWVYKVLSDSWIPDFIWNKFLPISPSESNLDLPKQEVLVPVTKRSVSPKPLETAGGWVWNPVRVSRTTLGSLSAEVHRSVTSLCVDKNAGEGNYSQRVIESNGGAFVFFYYNFGFDIYSLQKS